MHKEQASAGKANTHKEVSCMATLKGKNVYGIGLIEIRDEGAWSGYRYGLYVNGTLKEQSDDLDFILREYDRMG